MAEKLRKNALFRFRCAHCNLRLKTQTSNKGRMLVCPQCKHAITAERAPQERPPEESIIQRLDATVDQWVRTTCTCGKLIKAPAAFAGRTGNCPQCGKTITMPELGETLSSSLEVSTLVQAPSEESLLMAVGDMDSSDIPAPTVSDNGITYSRLTPLKQEPQEQQFVRAACICGAEVHAGIEMAGKTVHCPKCKTLLRLPNKPLARPIFDFDDMASQDISFGGESLVFKPHMVSGGENLFDQIDASKEIDAIPVTEAEWKREKQTRAINIRTIRGASPLETQARVLALAVSDAAGSVKKTLWGTPIARLAVSSCFLGGAFILFAVQYQNYWSGIDNSLPSMAAVQSVQFYDTGSGIVFSVPSDTLPPTMAPSQSDKPTQEPAGFRAYRFSCDNCSSDQEIFVGFIESMTPAAKSGWQRRMEVTGDPRVTPLMDPSAPPSAGRLVSKPTPIHWVEASSPEGSALIHTVLNTKCPNSQSPQWCGQ